jgi:RNA polymerase sigma factor (sigma-70 family)
MLTGGSVPQAGPLSYFSLRLLGDRQLARLAARGHAPAFEAIFRRYHQELFRYCRAILGDPEEAQDALQSTMAAALRALPEERREIALRPWLYRIAHNEAVSLLRRRPAVADPDSQPEPAGPGADSEVEARERLHRLVADLQGLPERQRAAVVMRELSGLSYAEIGNALDLRETRARQAVYEARVALRDLEGGREMECEDVRRALSEQDRRMLRGRRLRAHLRACEGCRDFRAAIEERRSELDILVPPLPAAAASGLVASILGETKGAGVGAATGGTSAAGAAGAGSGAGAAGATIAVSTAVKGASLVAAVAVGAGAAGATGVVGTPWVGDRGESDLAGVTKSAARGAPEAGSGATRVGAGAMPPSALVAARDRTDPAGSPASNGGDDPDSDAGDPGPQDPVGAEEIERIEEAPGGATQPDEAGAQGGEPPSPDEPRGPPADSGPPRGQPTHPSPPEHAGGGGGPPPHAGGPDGPPEHAGGPQGGPPADPGPPAGPPANPGRPEHVSGAGGPPPHSGGAGGAEPHPDARPSPPAHPDASPEHGSAGGPRGHQGGEI